MLDGGDPVAAGSLIEMSLLYPVANGLSRGLKLGGKFTDGATSSSEFDDLPAKLRGIGLTCSWHVDLLFVDKWKIVHQTGLTPITNADQDHLDLEEALVLYRVRWQVELLFKLWKQHGGIDQWRSKNPQRILCEFYAKLLAMLVLHWVLLLGSWSRVDRSMFKAAQTVQSHALHVMLSLERVSLLRAALLVLEHTLAAGCRIGKRGRPATYQLLLDLNENPLT